MDLMQFNPGQAILFKKPDVWEWTARTVKSVTGKQIRFTDRGSPSFVNAIYATGQIFATAPDFWAYAVEATKKKIHDNRHEWTVLEAELKELEAKSAAK